MSFSRQLFALMVVCMAIVQLGCDNQTSTEKLEVCFEEMKSATVEFYDTMREVTDAASAEAKLPKLETSHQRLAIAVHELDLAELTSSRQARNVKREIEDFKKEQKDLFKGEFDRLQSDKYVKAILEPFLTRINAIQDVKIPK